MSTTKATELSQLAANLTVESGNVGIGTDTPTEKLDVVGNIKTTGSVTASTLSGALTGNAVTATRLETARTINGISFDGSANITLPGTDIAQGTRTTITVPITSSTGTSATLSAASTTLAGVMTSVDKTKLDDIAAGAQVNTVTSVASKTGAVTLVKADVGLSNVDNTSDATKNSATVTLTNKTLTNPVVNTPNLTGGTINNATIGASTPSTVASTNLSYTGTLTGGTGVINIGSGQVFKGANGNVGIGTSTPDARLSVIGATNSEYARIGGSSATERNLRFSSFAIGGTNDVGHIINAPGSSSALGTLIFQTNSAERMRINNAGNVGIGTSLPAAKLNLAGALGAVIGSGGSCIKLTNTDSGNFASIGAGIVGVNDIGMDFSVNGVRRMVIDSAGNVGIGTSSPNAKTEIFGGALSTTLNAELETLRLTTTTGNSDILRFYKVRQTNNNNSFETAAWRIQQRIDVTDMGYIQFNGAGLNNGMAFGTSNTERARIDSAGNVGIGTSSPTLAKTVINNTFNGFQLALTTTSSGTLGAVMDTNGGFIGTLSGATTDALRLGTGGTERMRIDSAGNVGIGTSSPGAKLQVTGGYSTLGDFNAGTTGTLPIAAGVSFSTNISNGLAEVNIWNGIDPASHANTGLLFCQRLTSSTRRDLMFLHNNGNVGIGTSSPQRKLQSSAGVDDNCILATSIAGNSFIGFADTGTTSQTGLSVRMGSAGNSMVFQTGGTTERLRIDASGNVGIGTSSPASKLHVAGSFRQTGATVPFEWTVNPGAADFYKLNAVGFADNLIVANSSGNVGIGTSLPAAKLNLAGALGAVIGSGGSCIKLTNTDSGNFASIGAGIVGVNQIGMDFSVNGVRRMVIDSSGNLLVGTTNARGKITGAANSGDILAAITASNNTGYLYDSSSLLSSSAAFFIKNNAGVGSILCTSSSTSFITSSDYRLKENVAPMQNALATVAQLNPVTYTWKVDGSVGQGFIAHELQAVVPDCVAGEKDAVDEEGNPQYQGVDTSFLVATLVSAVQELSAKVDALQSELNTLKGN